MKFLNPFKQNKTVDPFWGELKFDGGTWNGSKRFAPSEAEVSVYLAGTENGVSDFCTPAFTELEKRYSELQESIAIELSNRVITQFSISSRTELTSSNILALVELEQIWVKGAGEFELFYGFNEGSEFDTFEITLFLKGWKPLAHSIGD